MLLASTLASGATPTVGSLGELAFLWSVLADLLAGPELGFVSLLALGGMFDLGRGDDADATDDGDGADGGDEDGLADDPFEDGDDWGEMEDDDLDDWGDMDDGDSGVGELENRLNDMETELSSVSSSMKTVKEENRQLAETVEEADETIRKLLDVYEIVTRGINPFVDDAQAMAAAGQDGSFGLFGDAASDNEDPVDPELAAADAESFFDDDFDDFETDDPTEAEPEAEPEEAAADGGSGASFDELKAEYDADDGGWEDVADDEDETHDDEVDEADADEEAVEETLDDAFEETEEVDDVFEEEDIEDVPDLDDVGDDAVEPTADGDPDVVFDDLVEESTNGTGEGGSTESHTNGDARDATDEDAYLSQVPEHYGAELVLMDWARYLVSAGGAAGAVEAARHYERLGWISPPVRRRLAAVTTELVEEAAPTDPVPLGIEHHRESLGYVSRLAGRPAEGSLLRELGGT